MLQQLEGESEELAREKLPAARRALRRTLDGIRRYLRDSKVSQNT